MLTPLSGGGDPHPRFFQREEAIKTTWQKNVGATETHYQPNTFTTIHVYEWISAPGGSNQHRSVFLRDANVPDMPFSSNEGGDPEKLWSWMQTQRDDGRQVFAIPHNFHESKGLLFAEARLTGVPIGQKYAETGGSIRRFSGRGFVKENFVR